MIKLKYILSFTTNNHNKLEEILSNRFFYNAGFNNKQIQLCPAESFHIARTLRHKIGDKIHITDGQGTVAQANINSISKRHDKVNCTINKIETYPKMSPEINIYTAIPKGKIFFEMIKQLVSLGVNKIVPIRYEHSNIRTDLSKTKIHQSCIEAIKQSDNPYLPIIEPITNFDDAINQLEKNNTFFGAIYSKKQEINLKNISTANIFIGPEADFSSKEITILRKNATPIKLGQYIMKIETATITLTAQFL